MDARILNELKAMNDKLDLLVSALPPPMKEKIAQQILENQYHDAICHANNYNPEPLKKFLTTYPDFITTRTGVAPVPCIKTTKQKT